MTRAIDPAYLSPTPILDADHPTVRGFAREAVGGRTDPVERAVALYYAVRDGLWYDPYSPFYKPEHYRASRVIKAGRGYCVQKASVMIAAARALGIPARVSFATVRNHLATRQLLEYLGSDLFVYHGVVELFLEGRWVKATPAFNRELCDRHGVEPLEFDGRHDSIFQPYNRQNQRFMEYVEFHGTHADIPLDEILAAWRRAYGDHRVDAWIRMHETKGSARPRDFLAEEVVTD
ncbi:transglutaminase-like domain-containing protein [Deferrisoma camini]|uniref:transglutaminase-like domain-containing protein n=1 Tax=Deferrisoma camini TaxID=1035120 RepID=UPI00046D4DFB|nr:transglutaminase-like domain-containing protein [Deferrisoma camini]